MFEKQLELHKNEEISAIALVDIINDKAEASLIGAEIGVCFGWSTDLICRMVPNLSKIYAIDNYTSFTDWNGTRLTCERQALIREYAHNKLSVHAGKVDFRCISSKQFASSINDKYLDFIFIDGDHSYAGVLQDLVMYWPKIKDGGIFAGHDALLPDVNRALRDFFGPTMLNRILLCKNAVWCVNK